MTAGGFKNTYLGRGRYFRCTQEDCLHAGNNQFHQQQRGKWRPVSLTRGPRPSDFGVDVCPECETRGKLRSRGRFNKTRKYKTRIRRIFCAECEATFRLIAPGNLEKAPAAGFQRKHRPPECRIHARAMERSSNHRRGDLRVYWWRCTRRPCLERIVLDGNGRAVESTRARKVEMPRLLCGMMGCKQPRRDEVDGRKRYCIEHSGLSYFQRWWLKRRRRALIAETLDQRTRGSGRRSAVFLNEWGGWLAKELAGRGETYKSAARKADLAPKTVYNWLTGRARPEGDDPKWAHFTKRFAIDPNAFLIGVVVRGLRPSSSSEAWMSPSAS
jgi:hypothetical protein